MVVREIQNPVFDVIKFLPVEVGPIVPELRPATSTRKLGTQNKVTGRLIDLIPGIAGGSGALNVGSTYSNFVSNQVLENYYNVNQKSMEINADYSNFENFVTFGSAQKRIDVFKAKLTKIEELVKAAPVLVENLNISGSSAEAGTYNTVFGTLTIAGSAPYVATLSQTDSTVYDILSTTSGGDDFTHSGTTVNTNTTVTHVANTNIIAGVSVSGDGIPINTTISSITDSTHFVLSNAATAGATVTLTFAASVLLKNTVDYADTSRQVSKQIPEMFLLNLVFYLTWP